MSYDEDEKRREDYRRDERRKDDYKRDDQELKRIGEESTARQREREQIWRRATDAVGEHNIIKARAALGMDFQAERRSESKNVTPEEQERRNRLNEEKIELVGRIKDLPFLPEMDKMRWLTELLSFDPTSASAEKVLTQNRQKLDEITNATPDTSRGPLSELFRPL